MSIWRFRGGSSFAVRPVPSRLGRWHRVLADALDQNLSIGVGAAVDHRFTFACRRGRKY
jgi:hypothetical protein